MDHIWSWTAGLDKIELKTSEMAREMEHIKSCTSDVRKIKLKTRKNYKR